MRCSRRASVLLCPARVHGSCCVLRVFVGPAVWCCVFLALARSCVFVFVRVLPPARSRGVPLMIFFGYCERMKVEKSEREDKRLKAIFDSRVVHFGSPSPSRAYVDHGDAEKRRAYLARHKPRENWNNPFSAGALARWVLWGNSTDINKNIGAYRKRFSM